MQPRPYLWHRPPARIQSLHQLRLTSASSPPTPMRIRNRPLHRCLPTNASPPRKPPAGRPDLALEGAAMAAGGGKEENLGAYLTQIGLVRRRRRRAAGGSSPQPAGGSMGPGVVDHGAAPGQVEVIWRVCAVSFVFPWLSTFPGTSSFTCLGM